jgi:uncharacterized protein (TIRG00374 family)
MIFFGLLAFWIFLENPSILISVKSIEKIYVICIAFITIVAFFVMAIQFNLVAKLFGLKLPLNECLGLTAINTLINQYLPANSGLLMRGVYLKKKYEYSLSSYAAMTVSAQLLSLLFLGAMALVALAISLRYVLLRRFWYIYFVPLMSITLVGMAFFLAFRSADWVDQFTGLPPRIRKIWKNFCKGLVRWRARPGALGRFFLTVLGLYLLRTFRLFICFVSLGNANITFWEVGLIQVLVSASLIVSITPANLGIREGLILFVAELVDLDTGQAFVAGLLDRAVSMSVFFVIGSFFGQLLLRKTT